MPAEGKAQVEGIDTQAVKVPLKRAPTLYLIIAFKLAKGLLAAFLAFTLYFQPAKKLQPEYEEIIGSPVVKRVFYYLRIHPENKFFQHVTTLIDNASDVTVHHAAVGHRNYGNFARDIGKNRARDIQFAGRLNFFSSSELEFAHIVTVDRDPVHVLDLDDMGWWRSATAFRSAFAAGKNQDQRCHQSAGQ